MSNFPNSPRLLKGGITLLDPETGAVLRIIPLQYNPDTLTRTLQVKGAGAESGGDRSEVLRLKGPPVETIKFEAEIDATDQLEFPDRNPVATDVAIAPQLAALESLVNPTSRELPALNEQSQSGTLAETNGVAPDVPRRAQRSDALRNFEKVAMIEQPSETRYAGDLVSTKDGERIA